MITIEETRQDAAAEQAFAKREQEVESRREDLSRQLKRLNARAGKLQAKLAEQDGYATAEQTGALEDIEEDKLWVRYGIYQLVADALATVLDDGEVVYEYTAADVKAWSDRAEEMGASKPKFDSTQLRDLVRMRQVPNVRFREHYLASKREENAIVLDVHRHLQEMEAHDDADYGSKNFISGRHPQARHFERMLGIQTRTAGSGSEVLRLFIPYELGVALMRALGMTTQEAGL